MLSYPHPRFSKSKKQNEGPGYAHFLLYNFFRFYFSEIRYCLIFEHHSMSKSATINYELLYKELLPKIGVLEHVIAKQSETIGLQQELIAELKSQNALQQKLIAELQADNAKLRAANAELEIKVESQGQELRQLKKMIFGSRSERFVPSDPTAMQPLLFGEQQDGPSCSVTGSTEVSYVKTRVTKDAPKLTPKRMKLPEHLRRETIMLEPEQDVSGCRKIGEEITEELEYKPGELYVNQYVRPKYVCPVTEEDTDEDMDDDNDSDTKIVIADAPERSLDKCIAGPALLARVVVDKYLDHLPINRQMQRFSRAGVNIPLSTLIGWIAAVCKLIAPLGQALTDLVLQSGYLHADETGIKVLDKDKKGKTHQGWFWVYLDSRLGLVFFDYQPFRNKDGPDMLLKDFKGYLQTDGYETYTHFDDLEGVIQLNCMAHARRKFSEAMDNDAGRATYVLEQMGLLYDIERKAKDWPGEKRLAIRQQEAVPILEALGKWMKQEYGKLPPQSAIAKALAYSIRRWDKLCIYTTRHDLFIDNNAVERSLRGVAVGRKNYLFCGSHVAARRAAVLYSLIGTCKLHGVNPEEWLKDVLIRIPRHPINRINELLPHVWCKQRSEAVLA
jgi:transposase